MQLKTSLINSKFFFFISLLSLILGLSIGSFCKAMKRDEVRESVAKKIVVKKATAKKSGGNNPKPLQHDLDVRGFTPKPKTQGSTLAANRAVGALVSRDLSISAPTSSSLSMVTASTIACSAAPPDSSLVTAKDPSSAPASTPAPVPAPAPAPAPVSMSSFTPVGVSDSLLDPKEQQPSATERFQAWLAVQPFQSGSATVAASAAATIALPQSTSVSDPLGVRLGVVGLSESASHSHTLPTAVAASALVPASGLALLQAPEDMDVPARLAYECAQQLEDCVRPYKAFLQDVWDFVKNLKTNYAAVPNLAKHELNSHKVGAFYNDQLDVNICERGLCGRVVQLAELLKNNPNLEPLFPAFLELLQNRITLLMTLWKRELIEQHNAAAFREGCQARMILSTLPEVIRTYSPLNRFLAQMLINQFEFRHSILKIIWVYVYPLEKLAPTARRIINTSPILMRFLAGEMREHPVPHDSFEDIEEHRKEFYVDITLDFGVRGKRHWSFPDDKVDENLDKICREAGVHKSKIKEYYKKKTAKVRPRVKLEKVYPETAQQAQLREHKKAQEKKELEDKEGRFQVRENALQAITVPTIGRREHKQVHQTRERETRRIKALSAPTTAAAAAAAASASIHHVILAPDPYIPPTDKKEKVKTRGAPDPSKMPVEPLRESESVIHVPVIPDVLVPFFQLPKGKITKDHTYESFKVLFERAKGYIDESTASSHCRLLYTSPEGIEYVGGIWKYHFPMDRFDHNSIRELRQFIEKCYGISCRPCKSTLYAVLSPLFDNKGPVIATVLSYLYCGVALSGMEKGGIL